MTTMHFEHFIGMPIDDYLRELDGVGATNRVLTVVATFLGRKNQVDPDIVPLVLFQALRVDELEEFDKLIEKLNGKICDCYLTISCSLRVTSD